ncbi:MAG: hypothetical protein ACTSO9_02180 [Candidatus Helarchaeota archaeon]
MPYRYADIPEMRTKAYYALGRHLWKMYKELGYDYLREMSDASSDMIYPEINARLNTTIHTARDIIQGKLPADKTLSFMLFPPVVAQRGDLTQGSMKLLYGESCDLTFIVMNDNEDGEIFFILNGHEEDGIPVDWWLEKPDSELLDRRHQKLGYKLRDIPKKIKDLTKCGLRIIEVLKDIRNERTPQWNLSAYLISMVWGTGMSNALMERSTWEGFATIWDGVNAKRIYKLPDHWYCYIPWPPMVGTLFGLPRISWTLRITGLFMGHKFFLQGLEDIAIEWLVEKFPESYEISVKNQIEEVGIPLPYQTVECQPPDLGNKAIYKSEEFDFKYPNPENFVKASDLDLELEEVLKGVYLDLTHEHKEKATHDDIISLGIGRDTTYIK